MALDALLAGLTAQDFMSEYWDKAPLKLPGISSLFADSYSIARLEQAITQRDARYPLFKMARHGSFLKEAEYTKPRSVAGKQEVRLPDLPAVYTLWNNGASIVLHSLQLLEPDLIPLARELETDLGHPIHLNAYLTPANSFGFNVHIDINDVFVVQIEGTKRWKIWGERVQPTPYESQVREPVQPPASNPLIETTLLPGEVLYIPRGFFHCAETDDCASLHLTVGLANQRRLDAVRDIFSTVIQKLADGPDTFWRDSLSVGQFEADEDILNEKLDEVVDLVRQHWSPARTAEKFARSRSADHLGLFDGKNSADNISANTTLVMAPWIKPLIQPAGNKIEVFYAGRKLVLPEAALPAIEQIIEARMVKPSELSSLSAESALGIAKHLMKEGLLRIAG